MKKIREDKAALVFCCKKCSTEFSVPKAYGVVHHRCSSCGRIHKVWTGKAIQRDLGVEDCRSFLKVKRIALKVDSAGRVRVLGEIENQSRHWIGNLILTFVVRAGAKTHSVLAFPGLDIAKKGVEERPRIRPNGSLEFHHWVTEIQGKLLGTDFSVDKIDLTGELINP